MPRAGGSAKTRVFITPVLMKALSEVTMSNGGIGSGKCIPLRNQVRAPSRSRRASRNRL